MRNKMRYSLALFLLLVMSLLCTGCTKGSGEIAAESGYMVYYLNAAGNQLVGSNYETGNVDGVLAGEIEEFVIAYHKWRASQ